MPNTNWVDTWGSTAMKQWYESLCENYAKTYENDSFTKGTTGECDFIEKELMCNE